MGRGGAAARIVLGFGRWRRTLLRTLPRLQRVETTGPRETGPGNLSETQAGKTGTRALACHAGGVSQLTILRRKVLSIPILVALTMDHTAAQTPDNVTSPTSSLAAASNGSPCEPFGVSASQQALSLCDLFRDAAVNANWERASDAANSLIQLVPDKGVGYFCAGYVALRRGQYLRAILSLEAALDRASEVGVVHLNLALSYLGIQQHKLFEAEVQWLIANRPREPLAYYYLAVYYTDFLKQPERAVDLFREALRLSLIHI